MEISEIWKELETETRPENDPTMRVYRALGKTAIGIRAGFIPRDRTLELLIEVPPNWEKAKAFPEWRGMRFELLPLSLPPRENEHHLRLFLEDPEHKSVFLTFCQDLVDSLERILDMEVRLQELEECVQRWGRFFEKCGPGGLSSTAQRGLFAELTWLKNMLEAGISPIMAASSWKGCEKGYHDFDLKGEIVEAKSTMTKEPRSVRINNERQLDDRGLLSLHLFILTLQGLDGGGITLPDLVQSLRIALSESVTSQMKFERCLVSAGYLDRYADFYKSHYVVKKQELFNVRTGFPRIIEVPPGVGRLKFSVSVSACQPYEVNLSTYLSGIVEENNA